MRNKEVPCISYAGADLEKDLRFLGIVESLKSAPEVFILSVGKRAQVQPCKRSADRTTLIPEGEPYLGYRYHYLNILYRGFVFYIEASSFYPFPPPIGENSLGWINFIPYVIDSAATAKQAGYFSPFEGLRSLDNWIDRKSSRKSALKGAHTTYFILNSHNVISTISRIVNSIGGFREMSIWRNGICLPTETWNPDHKVVRVLSVFPEPDGHFNTFEVDLVTRIICG